MPALILLTCQLIPWRRGDYCEIVDEIRDFSNSSSGYPENRDVPWDNYDPWCSTGMTFTLIFSFLAYVPAIVTLLLCRWMAGVA